MQKLVEKIIEDYILKAENSHLGKEGRRLISNPIIYLFIGDQSLPALKAVYELNQKKWANHDGILYLHAYLKETWAEANVISFKAAEKDASGKRSRPSLYEAFYQDEQKLVDYNQLLRQLNVRFAELGNKFASFQKVNISVITEINDPLTVILSELAILLEHSLRDLFTMTYLDAFCLLEERTADEGTSVLGLSFLRELKKMQEQQFSFSKDILVTKDRIRISVTRKGPLFDLVYLLSDKDERGMFTENSIDKNAEIINAVNLIKNKKVNENEHFPGNEMYNNVLFSKNIQNDERIPAFVSAGFSKVSRPNEAIVINVLYYFYIHLKAVIGDRANNIEQQKVIELLELDNLSIHSKVSSFFPPAEIIEEMLGLMPSDYMYHQLENLTLREAEEILFGDSAKVFFQENLLKPFFEKMKDYYSNQPLQELLQKRVEENSKYGFFCAYRWTDEQVVQYLLRLRSEYIHQSEVLKEELNTIYSEYGAQQDFRKVPFSKKRTTRNFISHLINRIYQHKCISLLVDSKLELVNYYMLILEECHEEYKKQIEVFNSLEMNLYRRKVEITTGYQNKINQNIPEYYERIVQSILQELTEKRSTEFYFEEKNLGKLTLLLKQGLFTNRVIEMCQRFIFESGKLDQTFEQEILARGNVMVDYGDPQVLTKEELFHELYQLLEKDSACHIHLFDYSQKHKYEEKYYLGDFQSSFIQYVLGIDKDNRPYRLGCIHENRASGIEKLSLMGGFAIEDLRFYQNNIRYYEKYRESGYEFHPEPVNLRST
ncbi:hypothetical protein [Cytobacillus praedii]|uniref:Transcription initiation factor TFIID n=1 Tax=Cytobacillus praedii TaxID=1742358 RepID=A0A4R1B1W0_9BACI|nr:hypothetical protein [Cytobacillus praedii]TCJ04074.1 hypothetical protein E0Y62_11560 [Cytobacillus praedii]